MKLMHNELKYIYTKYLNYKDLEPLEPQVAHDAGTYYCLKYHTLVIISKDLVVSRHVIAI